MHDAPVGNGSWDERAVMLRAWALVGEAREAYLREACPDEDAQARIAALIRDREAAGSETMGSEAMFEAARLEREAPAPRSLDEFNILQPRGSGGRGVVYLAQDEVLGRQVALKVLSDRHFGSDRVRERFADEARLAASLRHPAIVTVFKFGEVGESCYIASEVVDGPHLGEVIAGEAKRRSLGDALSERRAWRRRVAEIVASIGEALEAAHQQQIIHRDVKPSNILIDATGAARLTDFGIAKRVTETDLGQHTAVVGSMHYMSPEQAAIDGRPVDARSDVFSLGVTLYEALALKRPFEGATVHEVLRAIQAGDPPALRSVDRGMPRDLATICHKALEKRPADRYQRAAHFAADLRCWLHGDPILARPPGAGRRAVRVVKRHRVVATVMLAAMLIALTGLLAQRGEESRAHAAFLRETAAAGALADLSPQSLAEVVARGHRLRAARGSLAPDLERLRLDVDALMRERLAEARAALAEVDGSVGRIEEGARQAMFDAAHRAALEIATVCAQDEAVDLFLDAGLTSEARLLAAQTGEAEIRVDAAAIKEGGGTLTVYSLMRFPGSPVELLTVDAAEAARVGPGYYRARVTLADGRLREWSLLLRLRERVALAPDWEREPAMEDMALIEGARFAIPTGHWGDRHPYAGAVVDIEPFLLDRYEVSNAEYRQFYDSLDAEERARRLPDEWLDGEYPHGALDGDYAAHAWDDLPVVQVNWFSANAYAAWAGKRLPSFAEWLLACAGTEDRPYPFGEWDDEATLPANVHAPINSTYAERAMPVRSMPEGASPEGIHHLYGNVQEWTESVGFYQDDDGLQTAMLNVRMFMGGAWDAGVHRNASIRPQRHDTDRMSSSNSIGFRCAKSLDGQSLQQMGETP